MAKWQQNNKKQIGNANEKDIQQIIYNKYGLCDYHWGMQFQS